MQTTPIKASILDKDTLYPEDLDFSGLDNAKLHWQNYAYTDSDHLVERIQDKTVIFTNKVKLDKQCLEQAPKLRYIGVFATGVDHIDLDYAKARGLVVNNVTNYCSNSVAQFTLGLILNLATSQPNYFNQVKAGKWSQGRSFSLLQGSMMELSGKKLLLVGYGNLAKAVERLAKGFGLQVLLTNIPGGNRYPDRLDFDQALGLADIVSLHCPLTANTKALIDQRALGLMQNHSLLINTARGGLIDNQALINALEQGQIAGAALDVLDQEPPPADHPLLNRSDLNLLLSPHVAWGSTQARQNLMDQSAQKLQNWLKSQA